MVYPCDRVYDHTLYDQGSLSRTDDTVCAGAVFLSGRNYSDLSDEHKVFGALFGFYAGFHYDLLWNACVFMLFHRERV